MWIDLVCTFVVLGVALALRPWRAVSSSGPPWPWILWCAVMPWVWGLDHLIGSRLVQPLSGASLLVLMAGWPLACLAMAAVATLMAIVTGMDGTEALHRLVWLGLLPGSLAMLLGALVRRWLPHHLFIYILGRGFFVTLLATAAATTLAAWFQGVVGVSVDGFELLVGRWLAAWGDAILAGMIVSIFVAFRPEYLATYSDRLYLPRS